MADTWAIEADDVRKAYGAVDALRGLTLRVPAGSISGFLGRNGAGKTTTIKLLLGMAHPASGRARVLGLDAFDAAASVAIRRRVGFVSEEKDLYDSMTAAEIIRFTARFFPKWRDDLEREYGRRFALPLDRKIKTLSRGTRTKLALLLALCRSADLLILDEPTSGLDPAAAEDLLKVLVQHVANDGTTVFFSSHQLAEVDQIADHVAIVHRGRVIVSGALDDLRENFRRIQLVFDREAPQPAFRAPGIERVHRVGRVLTVTASAGAAAVLEEARSLRPISVDVAPVSLKEIFLESVAEED